MFPQETSSGVRSGDPVPPWDHGGPSSNPDPTIAAHGYRIEVVPSLAGYTLEILHPHLAGTA